MGEWLLTAELRSAAEHFRLSTGHFGSSELQHWVKQRLKFETRPGTWDEAIIDGYGLKKMLLAKDPGSALVAVFYLWNAAWPEGPSRQIKMAKRIQSGLFAQYGVQLPIVGINQSTVVSTEKGPFFEYEPSVLHSTTSSSTPETMVV